MKEELYKIDSGGGIHHVTQIMDRIEATHKYINELIFSTYWGNRRYSSLSEEKKYRLVIG